MRCLGRTKKLKRCKNNCKYIFCHAHKLQWWIIVGIIATLGGLFQDVISPVISQVQKNVSRFENSTAFSKKNSSLKILILPFQTLFDKEKSFAERIQEQLKEINLNDTLDIEVKYFRESGDVYDFQEMINLGKRFNADLVLSGYESMNEQLIKYSIMDPYNVPDKHLKSDTFPTQSFQTISSLHNGFIPNDLSNLIYVIQGARKLRDNNFEEAVYYYSKVKIDYNKIEIYEDILLKRGACYLEVNDYKNAKTDLLKVLLINNKNLDGINNYGIVLINEGKANEAKKLFFKCLEIDSSYINGYSNLGGLYLGDSISRLDSAIYYLTKGLSFSPQSIDLREKLARVYMQIPSLNFKAKIIYHDLIKEDNTKAEFYNSLGILYENELNYDSASYCYFKSIQLNSNYFEAIANYGQSQAHLGNLHVAQEYLNKAINIKADANLYYNLGVVLMDKMDYKEAITNFEKSITKNPNDEKTYYNLGIAYLKLNNISKSVGNFEKAIQIEENYEGAYFNLTIAYIINNDLKNALNNFNIYKKRFKEKISEINRLEKIINSAQNKGYDNHGS